MRKQGQRHWPPIDERFFSKIAVREECGEACWEWTAATDDCGYGTFGNKKAHRFSYEFLCAPIPAGLDVDHLCHNRRCVNPDHLEPVTHLENIRRNGVGYRGRWNACPKGHPFDEANTGKGTAGRRYCIACSRERTTRTNAARRAAKEAARGLP